jgi:DNA-binding beta-propeller fold protein YncE
MLIVSLLALSAHAQVRYRFETFAGSTPGFLDGPGKAAKLHSPEGIAIDAQGNLYVTEYRTSLVRKIDPQGNVSLLAGQSMKTGYANGPGPEALFDRPHGVAVDKAGNVYVCDMKNFLIRMIAPDGRVSTVAGRQGVSGTKDGVGEAAELSMPEAVVVDSRGNLFFTDTYNFTIRKIDPDRRVTTVAGKPGVAGYADGTGETVRFNKPIGLAIDAQDNLYIADSDYDGKPNGNCLIRKMDRRGRVTTLAGVPGEAGHRYGPAKQALFNRPVGIAVTPDGVVFVADTEADLIRMIDKKGNVTTIGGQYLQEKSAEGIGPEAAFFDPQALVMAPNGDLYITDTHNSKIIVGRRVK